MRILPADCNVLGENLSCWMSTKKSVQRQSSLYLTLAT